MRSVRRAARVITHDPLASCADPLTAPAIDTNPTDDHIRTATTQPFPFYGIITVTCGHQREQRSSS